MTKLILLVLLLIPTTAYLMDKKPSKITEENITEIQDFVDVYLGKKKRSKLKRTKKCCNLVKLYNKLILKKLADDKTDDEIKAEVKQFSDYFEDDLNNNE